MDDSMKQIQGRLIEIEKEAEDLLLGRQQLVENDKLRNGNREALTALRKRARTTKTSVSSPFQTIMKQIEGLDSRPLVQEVCNTCGKHEGKENMWMMLPGSDVFLRIPFHAAHTILEKGLSAIVPYIWCLCYVDQEKLEYEAKKLQSYVKEKSFMISEKGLLADTIGQGALRSLVVLEDKSK